MPGAVARLLAVPMLLAVRGYRVVGSPLIGGHCRFHPTCSAYALEALERHGAFRGGALVVRRILRCHPLGGGGFDPVPPAAGEEADASRSSQSR